MTGASSLGGRWAARAGTAGGCSTRPAVGNGAGLPATVAVVVAAVAVIVALVAVAAVALVTVAVLTVPPVAVLTVACRHRPRRAPAGPPA